MIINAGKLDRTLEIVAVQASQDALGQPVEQTTSLGTMQAGRLEMRTQDSARAGQKDTFAMVKFVVRYRTGLTTSHMVRTGGKTYSILSIEEPDRRATMILTCEEKLS